MKIMCWRFHIKTPFTFRDIRTWDMWKVCLQTFTNIKLKLAYFSRNLQTSWANNSTILRTKNAKFSRYCLYMNTNIYWDFEICISVPLSQTSLILFIIRKILFCVKHNKAALVQNMFFCFLNSMTQKQKHAWVVKNFWIKFLLVQYKKRVKT